MTRHQYSRSALNIAAAIAASQLPLRQTQRNALCCLMAALQTTAATANRISLAFATIRRCVALHRIGAAAA
jgi:hypothetical protein